MFDVIIKNGKVVNHVEEFDADIAVLDGKIAAIGKDLGDAKRVIDAEGNYVIPGCIDTHNHIGIFEDYETDLAGETKGHLMGGNTTVLNMIFGTKPVVKNMDDMTGPIPSNAYCDIGLYAALLSMDDMDAIEELASKGVYAYKFLLAFAGKFGKSLGRDDIAVDHGYMYEACKRIKKIGGLCMIHAENVAVGEWFMKEIEGQEHHLKSNDDGRPDIIEEIDLYESCLIAEKAGVPLYQVHSSVPHNPIMVDEFRARGNTVILETCPQYAIIDYYGKDYREGDKQRTLKEPDLAKIVPPIRSAENRDAMRKMLKAGRFDCFGTDSANNLIANKRRTGEFFEMIDDWSSAGLMLPMVIDNFFNEGIMTMPEVVRMTSYTAAKAFGYAPRKGTMEVGADADLVILDVNKSRVLKARETAPSWSDWCLWEDWEVKGWPTMTMLRGEVVFENDEFVGKPGYGQYVPAEPPFPNYQGANVSRTEL